MFSSLIKTREIINIELAHLYSEPRKPDIVYFFDNSKWKPGIQILKHHLELMKEINTPWLNRILTDDEI